MAAKTNTAAIGLKVVQPIAMLNTTFLKTNINVTMEKQVFK